MTIVIMLFYVGLSALALILMKSGTNKMSVGFQDGALSLTLGSRLLLGALLYIISFLLSLVLMQRLDLSFMYPLSAGIINLLVCILSVTVLKESIDITRWLGIGLITAGIVLMNLKR